jgi:hypothetical protein
MYYTLDVAKADNSTLGAFRTRDLFILQETNKRLPEMEGDRAAMSLMTHAAHMNTYEGTQACLDLVTKHFKSAGKLIADVRASLDGRYRQAWQETFGIIPVRPEDFAPSVNIPGVRPIPEPQPGSVFY